MHKTKFFVFSSHSFSIVDVTADVVDIYLSKFELLQVLQSLQAHENEDEKFQLSYPQSSNFDTLFVPTQLSILVLKFHPHRHHNLMVREWLELDSERVKKKKWNKHGKVEVFLRLHRRLLARAATRVENVESYKLQEVARLQQRKT